MTTRVRIRPATRTDWRAIAAIHAASSRTAYARHLPAAYLGPSMDAHFEQHWEKWDVTDEDVVLVAEDDAVRGFIAIWCRPDAYIDNLHVAPSSRSGGTGTRLLLEAARRLESMGHRTAYLWVVEDNQGATRLYERLGGQRGETKMKHLLVDDVAHLRVSWPDLSVLIERAAAPG